MEKSPSMPRLLASLKPGEKGVVSGMASCDLTPKMVEMGIYLGKPVSVLFQAPFGGPMAIDLGGYMLSLRVDEASLIVVEPEKV